MVNIFYEDIEILDLDPEFFVSWLSKVCIAEQNLLGDVSLIFCSDDYLLKVNKEYLQHDYYTDIITFDYSESNVSGDLFLSVDRIKENAVGHKVEFVHEINRVVVHGVLHLLGYHDKKPEDKTLMTKKEDKYLGLIVSRET